MKELTIEEKAKRYDEAIERMKSWAKGEHPECFCEAQKAAEFVFPELAESDDERIRKEILDYIIKCSKSLYDVQQYGKEKFEKWIAWLEKQGEHKSIGDLTQQESMDIAVAKCFEQGEQKPAICSRKPHQGDKSNPYDMSFSEAEEYTSKRGFDIPWMDGEVFIDERYITQTVGNILRWADNHTKQKPAEWSEEDEENFKWFDKLFRAESIVAGGRDIPQDRYLWFKNLKGRVQPKQEWSEEDETRLTNIIIMLKEGASLHFAKDDITKAVDFLKSLRPQNTLKPSDEHYELEEFAKIVRCNLTGISKPVQKLFEAKYLQLTGNKMYVGFKD